MKQIFPVLVLACLASVEFSHGVVYSRRVIRPSFLDTCTSTENCVTVLEGQTAVLQCHVEHLGTKTVVWRRAGEDMPLTVGTITYSPDADIQVHHERLSDTVSSWDLVKMLYECQTAWIWVVWRRVGEDMPLTVGTITYSPDADIQVHHERLSDTASSWDLVINNAQPSDAGGYDCQITTRDATHKSFTLNVVNI